ncbi:MAG: redox-regulated ATPase YchF [Fibrobacterota bacterium]
MHIGIIGLPQSGKTTVFNALTGSSAATGMGGAKDMNQSIVKVPDERIDALSKMFKPKKTTPATVTYLDLCGLGRGKITSDSINAEFLASLRATDAVLMVVRRFKDDSVAHPLDSIDALRDADNLNAEIMFADLIVVEKRLERIDKDMKKGVTKELEREKELMIKFKALLDDGKPIRLQPLTPFEESVIKGFRFLTQKPLFLLVNIDEGELKSADAAAAAFAAYSKLPRTKVLALSAKIEAEMAQLSEEEASAFRADLGLSEPALKRLIKESYELLGLISFLTAGEDECRAWTIARGTVAQKAAGEIHSDLEKGFIRAETVAYADLVACGGMNECKTAGKQRLEGKEYVVQDGDIINIRFNV